MPGNGAVYGTFLPRPATDGSNLPAPARGHSPALRLPSRTTAGALNLAPREAASARPRSSPAGLRPTTPRDKIMSGHT
jgi:hypothetical protein